tara:strand:+ start:11214 stop:12434 length:1221 start_codon:yes stop_codon:yes gene_type:complete
MHLGTALKGALAAPPEQGKSVKQIAYERRNIKKICMSFFDRQRGAGAFRVASGARATFEGVVLLSNLRGAMSDKYIDEISAISTNDVSRSTVFRHLAKLEECGLIRRRKVGWRDRVNIKILLDGPAEKELEALRNNQDERFGKGAAFARKNEPLNKSAKKTPFATGGEPINKNATFAPQNELCNKSRILRHYTPNDCFNIKSYSKSQGTLGGVGQLAAPANTMLESSKPDDMESPGDMEDADVYEYNAPFINPRTQATRPPTTKQEKFLTEDMGLPITRAREVIAKHDAKKIRETVEEVRSRKNVFSKPGLFLHLLDNPERRPTSGYSQRPSGDGGKAAAIKNLADTQEAIMQMGDVKRSSKEFARNAITQIRKSRGSRKTESVDTCKTKCDNPRNEVTNGNIGRN